MDIGMCVCGRCKYCGWPQSLEQYGWRWAEPLAITTTETSPLLDPERFARLVTKPRFKRHADGRWTWLPWAVTNGGG